MIGLLYLAFDLVDLRLQLVVVQAVRNGVGGEVEEGEVYGRHVVLVLRNPGRSDDTIWEGGSAGREGRYGRVQDPRCRCRNGWTARRRRLGVGGRICFLRGQLEVLASISPSLLPHASWWAPVPVLRSVSGSHA